jgi:hypothetical protein
MLCSSVRVTSAQYVILILADLAPRLEKDIYCTEGTFLLPNERHPPSSVAPICSQFCRFPPAKAVVKLLLKTKKGVSSA